MRAWSLQPDCPLPYLALSLVSDVTLAKLSTLYASVSSTVKWGH